MGCLQSAPAKKGQQQQEEKTDAPVEQAPVIIEGSPEEKAMSQLELVFDSIDTNKDKNVSREELATALGNDNKLEALLKEAGLEPSYYVLEQLGADDDGKVTWTAFKDTLLKRAVAEVKEHGELAAAEEPAAEKVLKQLRAIYDSIDANHDGAVSHKELKAKLIEDQDEHGLPKNGTFMELMKDADFDPNFKAFQQLDSDGDGVVTWEEFKNTLSKTALEEVKQTGEIAAAPAEEDVSEVPIKSTKWGCLC